MRRSLDIALGRRPVKQGLAAAAADHYLYRGEVVNNAIKMAGGGGSLASRTFSLTK